MSGSLPDLASLVAPVGGEAPAGADLREDFSAQSPYYRLRDARAEAREQERRSDHDPGSDAGAPPQWRTVRDLAAAALCERSKDLELMAWLTEALVRSDGLAGLALGATAMGTLADEFWDSGLFPVPDEDGIETRVAPIAGLNGTGADGTLMQPLRKLVLFSAPDGAPFTVWQHAQSEELAAINDAARRKARLAAGVVELGEVERMAHAQPPAHFAALRAEARAALRAWISMGERLDARAGAASPPTGRVRDLLSAILAVADRYAPPEEPEPEALSGEEVPEGEAAPAATGAAAPAVRAVTREDMLHELSRIADYFRRTEPHSPLAYTLEEAVRRGRLSWPELLAEVVPDGGARDAILVMLGIRPTPPSG